MSPSQPPVEIDLFDLGGHVKQTVTFDEFDHVGMEENMVHVHTDDGIHSFDNIQIASVGTVDQDSSGGEN